MEPDTESHSPATIMKKATTFNSGASPGFPWIAPPGQCQPEVCMSCKLPLSVKDEVRGFAGVPDAAMCEECFLVRRLAGIWCSRILGAGDRRFCIRLFQKVVEAMATVSHMNTLLVGGAAQHVVGSDSSRRQP